MAYDIQQLLRMTQLQLDELFTASAVYMIAEKAADAILTDASRRR